MSIKINNINTNIAKVNSDLNTRNSRQNSFDKLRAHLSEIKKNSQSIQKNQFFGVCLFYNRLTVRQFEKKFKSNQSFIKYIYGQKDKVQASESGTIIQIFANVPEITGMLPEVKLQTLHNLISLNNQSPKEINDSAQNVKIQIQTDADGKIKDETMAPALIALGRELGQIAPEQTAELLRNPFKVANKKAVPELEKVMMYPRFYVYSEENSAPSIGQICKFEFPSLKNQHVPTMGLGAFISVTSDTVDKLFPPKKLEEDKKKSNKDVEDLQALDALDTGILPLRGQNTDTSNLGAGAISANVASTLEVPEVTLPQRQMARRPTRGEDE